MKPMPGKISSAASTSSRGSTNVSSLRRSKTGRSRTHLSASRTANRTARMRSRRTRNLRVQHKNDTRDPPVLRGGDVVTPLPLRGTVTAQLPVDLRARLEAPGPEPYEAGALVDDLETLSVAATTRAYTASAMTERRDGAGSAAGGPAQTAVGPAPPKQTRQPTKPEPPTPAQLEELVTVELTETRTMSMLVIPSSVVSDANEARAEEVRESNSAFRERRKAGMTKADAWAQTFNQLPKAKYVQTTPVGTAEAGVQSSSWDIHDAFKKERSARPPRSEALRAAAMHMERAVVQNIKTQQQLRYREYGVGTQRDAAAESDSEDDSKAEEAAAEEARLELLWTWECDALRGNRVTAMDWNRKNTDMLVTSHGDLTFGNSRRGALAFWTLKNPHHPERTLDVECSVTSLAFAESNPYLLAAGLQNGAVHIYDVREASGKPTLRSALGRDRHSSPVWAVKWQASKGSQTPTLYSVGGDGKIKQWNMKKGFESSDIMSLKRVPNAVALKGSASMNTIRNRQASVMCMDFPLGDQTRYFVGTEDGIVQKCSVSYNEQVLRSYFGHQGPVYQLRASPFDDNYFLTASTDWTVRLWDQHASAPAMTIASAQEEVVDVCWSPHDACVFGSATRNGHIEVWNLAEGLKDPVVTGRSEREEVTALMFGAETPTLLAGSACGCVDIYRTAGLRLAGAPDLQESRLAACLKEA